MNVFPHFPIKCFHSKFTGSKVFSAILPFFASIPILFSCSAVYETCLCLFMFPSSLSSSSPLTSVHSIGSFFLSVSLLSYFSQFLRSFPLRHCRVHNCITERLFSQLTLFLLLTPHSVTLPDSIRTHVDPRTELYRLFISTAEKHEGYNGDGHQGR